MKRLLFVFLLLPVLALAAATEPLSPVYQGSKTITCGIASAATAFPTAISGQTNVEIQNAGSVAVFVEVGDSTIASAVATGYPVLAGQSKVITVGPSVTHVACISGTASQTVYVSIGRGF
jgi:hypothetical protein